MHPVRALLGVCVWLCTRLRSLLGVRVRLGVRVGLVVHAWLWGLRVIHLPILVAASASVSVVDHLKQLHACIVVCRLSRLSHTGEQRASTELLHARRPRSDKLRRCRLQESGVALMSMQKGMCC